MRAIPVHSETYLKCLEVSMGLLAGRLEEGEDDSMGYEDNRQDGTRCLVEQYDSKTLLDTRHKRGGFKFT